MATTQRTVAIKIALEGYREYQANIEKINRQNKILASELSILDSEYRGNGDDIGYLTSKAEILNKILGVQEDKLKAIGEELKFAQDRQKDFADAVVVAKDKVDKDNETIRQHQEHLDKAKEYLKYLIETRGDDTDAIKEQEDYIKQLNDELLNHQKQLEEDNKELELAKRDHDDTAKKVDNLTTSFNNQQTAVNDAKKAVQDNNKQLQEAQGLWDKLASGISKASDTLKGMKDSLEPVTKVLQDSVKSAEKFESAMAGVNKTFPGTEKEFANLTQDIKEMSTQIPTTTTDLAKIAETAGQLGIKANDISSFTRVVADLGETTNISSSEAATLLAQFENVSGFTKGEGAGAFEKFASALVELGNNSATTEADIMAMAQRFSSAGTLAGLSAPQILGMSTALSSVGIKAEGGGTSLTKLTQRIQSAVELGTDDLEVFAEVAGTSAFRFANTWKKDPVEAINMFIGGLHETYEEGDSVLQLLEEVGFGEIRLRQATMSLASSEKGLSYYVDMANKAWDDNNALTEEANKRYETTESKMTMMKNSIELTKIEIGEALLPIISQLVTGLKDIIIPIAEWIDKKPELVQTIGTAVASIVGLSTAVSGVNTVVSALTTLFASPATAAIVGIVGALGLLVGAYEKCKSINEEYYKSLEEHIPTLETYGQKVLELEGLEAEWNHQYNESVGAIGHARDAAEEYMRTIENLGNKKKLSKEEQEKYNEAVAKLQEIYPDINIEIDKQTGKIKGGTEALKDQIKSWEDLMMVQIYQDRAKKTMEAIVDLQEDLSKNNKIRKDLEGELNELNDKRNSLLDKEKVLKDKLIESQTSGIELTEAEKKEYQRLLDEINNVDKEIKEHKDNIADVELAIISEGDAMADLYRDYDKWIDKTKEVGKANDETAKTYDQSDKAKEGGEKTVKAFINGQERTFSSYEDMLKALPSRILSDMTPSESDAKKTGSQYVSGMIKGIESKTEDAKRAARRLGNAVNNATRTTFQEKSPSRVAMQIGEYYGEGLAKGLENEESHVSKVAKELALATNDAVNDNTFLSDLQMGKLNGTSATITVKQDSNTQSRLDSIEEMLNRYLPALAQMQVVMDTAQLVGSLAPKMDDYFADEQLAMKRGL